MTDHRHAPPIPARITVALDAIGAEGAWVDEALDGAEPMVDQWEAGELVPTVGQVEKLAELTGFPVAFFYKPVADWEHEPLVVRICQRGRRGDNGTSVIKSWIDWAGVLHSEELTPPRPAYRPPKPKPAATPPSAAARGRHAPKQDRHTPGVCVCGLLLDAPNRKHLPRKDPT